MLPVVGADLSKRLVPDELWEPDAPLLPSFGTSPATAHRRFTVWTEAGLWRRLHRAVLDELGAHGEVDWTSAIVDAASVRAKGGIADVAEPGRSRQEGQQAARAVRCPGHPPGSRRCC
ncbi:hypothetical protein [Streptomyces roseifaciens]|uniref:hypothetical protein n=1 Tax=Streptomyces roseifaciens TaxID=1488406 RepID=UPI0009A047A5|nr:hypothetical protein [Streptomyces roseifaciens]